jgi:DNA-binding NarL/FixJ family response regulator
MVRGLTERNGGAYNWCFYGVRCHPYMGCTVNLKRARLLLADDHDYVRASLRGLLHGAANLEVVAEAADGGQALELFRRLQPDIMLVDRNMPRLGGLELTRLVKQESPATRVVIVSVDGSPEHLMQAVKAGADAYVLKGTPRDALLCALGHVIAGDAVLHQRLAEYFLAQIVEAPDARPALFREPLSALEHQLLRLTAEGLTGRQIRQELDLDRGALSASMHGLLAKVGMPRP